MSGRKLDPREKKAWAGVAKSVRPNDTARLPDLAELDALLASKNITRQHPAKPAAGPLRHPLAIFAAEQRKPIKPPATQGLPNREGERKVRRGQMAITGTLDLHGHTQSSAEAALLGFLRQHQAARSACVLVITGKGKRGEGVLRQRFLQWLSRDDVRALVSSYAGAHQKHGGSGAFYVFLRKKP
jgi:DNA-nicking Smr family endonuclease